MHRIAVVGAGAIGGYVGGHLARSGHEVVLIDPWPEHIEAIRQRGLELTGVTPAEHFVVRPEAMHITGVQALSRQSPVDVAFIAVKSYDTEWATMLIRPYLAGESCVVSLQNCINEERIAAIIGWGRTVGCIAALISADLFEAGRIRRTSPLGDGGPPVFRVGESHGRTTRRIQEIAGWMSAVDSTSITSNLWGERWSKLCVNAMRNGVSAATGLSGNERDGHAAIRRLCIRLGGEAVRVGQALGFALEPIGVLDPERLARAAEGDAAAFSEVDARIAAGSNSARRSDLQRPSMAQDMLKGRRTEIDYINGYVAEQGRAIGQPTPANLALTEIVHRVERGEISAAPENLDGL